MKTGKQTHSLQGAGQRRGVNSLGSGGRELQTQVEDVLGSLGVFSLRRALAISYLLPVSAADLSLALWSLLPVGGLRAVVLLICWELG